MSNSNIPPSPVPPWARPVQSPVVETLTEDNSGATISLTTDLTYLKSEVIGDEPYSAVLPDGKYKRQEKTLMIPAEILATAADWLVTGAFADATGYKFTRIGPLARFLWDGDAWFLVGGNAEPQT